jgi:hypothetical protein
MHVKSIGWVIFTTLVVAASSWPRSSQSDETAVALPPLWEALGRQVEQAPLGSVVTIEGTDYWAIPSPSGEDQIAVLPVGDPPLDAACRWPGHLFLESQRALWRFDVPTPTLMMVEVNEVLEASEPGRGFAVALMVWDEARGCVVQWLAMPPARIAPTATTLVAQLSTDALLTTETRSGELELGSGLAPLHYELSVSSLRLVAADGMVALDEAWPWVNDPHGMRVVGHAPDWAFSESGITVNQSTELSTSSFGATPLIVLSLVRSCSRSEPEAEFSYRLTVVFAPAPDGSRGFERVARDWYIESREVSLIDPDVGEESSHRDLVFLLATFERPGGRLQMSFTDDQGYNGDPDGYYQRELGWTYLPTGGTAQPLFTVVDHCCGE